MWGRRMWAWTGVRRGAGGPWLTRHKELIPYEGVSGGQDWTGLDNVSPGQDWTILHQSRPNPGPTFGPDVVDLWHGAAGKDLIGLETGLIHDWTIF